MRRPVNLDSADTWWTDMTIDSPIAADLQEKRPVMMKVVMRRRIRGRWMAEHVSINVDY